MATEPVVEQQREDPTTYAGVLRFYELAKRAEWQVRDLPWGEIPPIPETKGAPQKVARRRDMWRSVITQQLQADEFAGRPVVPFAEVTRAFPPSEVHAFVPMGATRMNEVRAKKYALLKSLGYRFVCECGREGPPLPTSSEAFRCWEAHRQRCPRSPLAAPTVTLQRLA